MTDQESELWRIATRFCGGDPRTRRTTRATALNIGSWDGPWSLDEFTKMVADAIASIPVEYRDPAQVIVDGDECFNLTIRFVRPETDDEIAARVERALNYARREIDDERRQYERLAAKFGGGEA